MTPLNQLTAALTGRYDIEREIGAGGMATVYLARDVKHNRKVALKVLKPELGAVLGVERFLSEIQVTANLQHPNLLPLFDSGEANGLLFYVMPFVDGESLRARLDREKQLPVDEAVRIAVAIAGALDYAHEHGVIHRDLKPENILLQAGQPVIADFGIALAVSNAGGARVTQTGLSLGTPQYMSPEQATGDRVIDARSDIYSLSAMTYEMLVGDPPHVASTAQAIVAKVLTERPPSVQVARPAVGDAIAHAVERGLEKLPADRWTSAGEFAEAMRGKLSTGAMRSRTRAMEAGAMRGSGMSRGARTALAAGWLIAIGATSALAWLATRPAPQLPPVARFPLGLPDSVVLYSGGGTKLALSKDGTKLVMVGVKAGVRALYLRRIDDPVAQLVRGTETRVGALASGNVSPTFSPDGQWIAFQDGQSIKKVPTAGGTSQILADTGNGASWGEGGVIAYARSRSLMLGTAEGRDGRVIATADSARGLFGFAWPELLPGAKFALVSLRRGGPTFADSLRLAVIDLATGSITDLGHHGMNPRYVASGHIIFGRAGGLVFVAPFSLTRRELTGAPLRLLENVWHGNGGAVGIGVSDNGTLAYVEGEAGNSREFVIVRRDGAERVLSGSDQIWNTPRVSPDGRRIAVQNTARATGRSVWLIDVTTGARERVTPDDSGSFPEWRRDGSRLVITRQANVSEREYVARSPDRSAPDSVLVRLRGRPGALVMGPPRGFAVIEMELTGREGLYITPMDSIAEPRPLVVSSAEHHSPAISADGRTVAWVSDESGERQVYAQPLPGPGARVQVSVNGGTEPVWSRAGSTLFYRQTTGRILSAEVSGTPLRVVRHDSLSFVDAYVTVGGGTGRNWDVFPGDREFLFVRPRAAQQSRAYVVVNWTQLLTSAAGAAVVER